MKKKNKTLLIIFLVGFFIGVIGFGSTFFVYLSRINTIEINYDMPDKDNLLSNGLEFSSIDESIHLEKAIPTLDKFGIQEKGFSFSVKNNNLHDVSYELKLIDDESTIKNSNIRYELTKNNVVLGIFTLSEDGVIEKDVITSQEKIDYTIKLWLSYDSVVKVGRLSKKIAFNEIINEIDNKINKPVLTSGMIPVYYDNYTNSWYKTDENNSKWYSYENAIWANVVTVNNEKRKYYQESSSDTKIEIDDINSMWVWIPRFNYELRENDVNITFIKNNEPAYLAFNFMENELDGFWFTKFESGMKSDSECITSSLTNICNNSNNKLYFVPNYPFATKMTLANMFYAIRKMELKNNIYGFNGTGNKVNNDGTINKDNNNFDIHMIKNSEWQAVVLLANSIYGNKTNLVLNNNSNVTGKVYYENEEIDYNVIGKGTKASTTGNVYGIYDMSGGKREYVMVDNSELSIFNKKSNSGFNTKVKDYYYDKELIDEDTTMKLMNKGNPSSYVNLEPLTRGGYKNTGNIFNIYNASDYINKISVETNSRACLTIIKEKDNEEKKES